MPHREVLDGVLVIFGGAFLITPGLPHGHRRPDAPDPAHALGHPALPRAPAGPPGGGGRRARPDYDVEGSAREYDERRRPGLEP